MYYHLPVDDHWGTNERAAVVWVSPGFVTFMYRRNIVWYLYRTEWAESKSFEHWISARQEVFVPWAGCQLFFNFFSQHLETTLTSSVQSKCLNRWSLEVIQPRQVKLPSDIETTAEWAFDNNFKKIVNYPAPISARVCAHHLLVIKGMCHVNQCRGR